MADQLMLLRAYNFKSFAALLPAAPLSTFLALPLHSYAIFAFTALWEAIIDGKRH